MMPEAPPPVEKVSCFYRVFCRKVVYFDREWVCASSRPIYIVKEMKAHLCAYNVCARSEDNDNPTTFPFPL